MEYHYVVGYNTELEKWFVETDTTAYFPDGNIFDGNMADEMGFGWRLPYDTPEMESLDTTLYKTLEYIVDTFPIPQEESNG